MVSKVYDKLGGGGDKNLILYLINCPKIALAPPYSLKENEKVIS
jgi:hypothetical protein